MCLTRVKRTKKELKAIFLEIRGLNALKSCDITIKLFKSKYERAFFLFQTPTLGG